MSLPARFLVLLASAAVLATVGDTKGEIVAAEYFIGADPGEGSGTSLVTTTESTISSLLDEASLSLSALGAGTHSIHLRVQDGSGQWSNTLIKRVKLLDAQIVDNTVSAVAAAQDIQGGGSTVSTITAAEYFTGADLGEGNGTSLAISTESTISSLIDEAALSLSSLGAGTHSIQLRVKNGAEQWSNTLIKRVKLLDAQIAADTASAVIAAQDTQGGGPTVTTIAAAEYFTGSDLGEGNGIALAISTESTISSLLDEAALSLSSLGAGTHSIQLRVKDGAGQWSNTLIKRVKLLDAQIAADTVSAVAAAQDTQGGGPTVTTIAAAEYFTGSDLGEGNGIALAISTESTISSLLDEAALSLSSLGAGTHSIQLRVKDGAGQWSNTLIKRVKLLDAQIAADTVSAVAAAQDIQGGGDTVTTIAAAEYFIGADPGEGHGIPLATSTQSSISSLIDEVALSLSSLGAGTHSIQLRVRDGAGQWSNTQLRRVELYGDEFFSLSLPASNRGSFSSDSTSYRAGQWAQISAAANPGYVLGGWSGGATDNHNPMLLRMKSDQLLSAYFSEDINDDDNDGLSNYQEHIVTGTSHNVADSDNDSYHDGAEVDRGSNPLLDSSYPAFELMAGLLPDGQFQFSFASSNIKTYTIEKLSDKTWTALEEDLVGNGNIRYRYFTLDGSAYYRVIEQLPDATPP